ncbi:MAG: hypothetical protein AB8H80_03060 [Planctomycetota bacterium]
MAEASTSGQSQQAKTKALIEVLIRGILRRRILIAACGTLGVLAGAFKAVTTPNQYLSAGKLFVRPGVRDVIVSESTLSGIGSGAPRVTGTREAVLNEMQFLASPGLYRLAVERIGIDELLKPMDLSYGRSGNESWHANLLHKLQSWWFKVDDTKVDTGSDRMGVAAELLKRTINIVPEAGTSVISLYAFSHTPAQAQRILDGRLDAARALHASVYDKMAGAESVDRATRAMEVEADKAEQALLEYRNEKSVYDFEVQLKYLQDYVGQIETDLDKLAVEIVRSEKEKAAVQSVLKGVPQTRVAPGSSQPVLNPAYASLTQELSSLRTAGLTIELERNGTEQTRSRLRKLVQERIERTEEKFRQINAQLELPGPTEEHPEYMRLVERINDLTIEQASLGEQRANLQEVRKTARERLNELEKIEPQIRTLKMEAEQKRAAAMRFAEGLANLKVVQRLEQLNISNVQVMQRATLEPEKKAPSRGKLVVFGGAGGAAFGMALAALLALRQRRIRTRADVVLAGVPDGVEVLQMKRRRKADLDAAKLPEALQDIAPEVARLWTEIHYDASTFDGLALAVLPSGGADGGRMAAALAVGLALYSGERVAYISTDPEGGWLARRLQLPILANVGRSTSSTSRVASPARGPGGSAARGSAPLGSGVHRSDSGPASSISQDAAMAAEAMAARGFDTAIKGLRFYPAGDPKNPSAGVAGPGFTAMIDRLRDSHRFIVLEMQSLRTDPSGYAILHLVDGVQICVEVNASSRQDVKAAVNAVESAGARVVTALLQHPTQRGRG